MTSPPDSGQTAKRGAVPLGEPPGAFILDIALFPAGPISILNRIPEVVPGIYAWFKSFHYPDSPNEILGALFKDLKNPKFTPRKGSIKPYYDVEISSSSWLSSSKEASIRNAVQNSRFRNHLLSALRASVYFQTPLYVGSSNDLRRRVAEHLNDESPLSQRLKSAGIPMNRTLVMLIPMPSITEDAHAESCEQLDDNQELIFEEIFSRLFSPLFTLRLG